MRFNDLNLDDCINFMNYCKQKYKFKEFLN